MLTTSPSADRVYLDNSATTALCPAARGRMLEAMDCYANPSSVHGAGRDARSMVENARREVARALGIMAPKPGELIFTASGTEADNLAILGTARAKARRTANRILTTDSEHPAVREPLAALEQEGFEIVRLSTRGGMIDLDEACAAMDERLFMISMMLVNNETGARYPLEKIFSAARRLAPRAILHTDAVQGFLKVPFSAKSMGADLVTVSAHKIGGPKGVGALWINPALLTAKRIVPVTLGGGQESGFRSGTENTVGIAGFGAAAAAGMNSLSADTAKMRRLREGLIARLAAELPEVRPNLPAGELAPHVLSLTLPRIKSETMLNHLSGAGICVSAGSACSTHAKNKTSSALLAFGLMPAEADSTIRVSISPATTEEELDRFFVVLSEGVSRLVRF